MSFGVSLIVDFVMLGLLAATVYLAFRLNINLKHFRESRAEMEGLVGRLTANIDNAERAIHGMQNAARSAGRDLDKIISDAKMLADELKIMNESGNNLAGRLEKLAERNRELSDKIEAAGQVAALSSSQRPQPIRLDEGTRGFAIHDRDFEAGSSGASGNFDDAFDEEDDQDFGGLQSQAERELFEALQKGKAGRTV